MKGERRLPPRPGPRIFYHFVEEKEKRRGGRKGYPVLRKAAC